MSYGDGGGAVGYLVGKAHDGIALMFTMMNHARLAVGVQGLSISERAYQQALAYARERVQGSAPGAKGRATIIHHPDVRRMLMLMKSGTEAMRALCYATAASLDHMHRGDDAAKARHASRFALLTPVVKAWCTELAQELTSLGIQVHGGMGYVEETGAAQHFRDARIVTIYEGTTGIQANDFVGRKIIKDNGAAMRDLIAEMRAADMTGADMQAIGSRLHAGIDALEQAARWLLERHGDDANLTGAVAVNLLMLAGTVSAGWYLARGAAAAAKRLAEGGDREFLEAKLATARFYAEHYLPRARSYLETVQAGAGSVMALRAEQF
jgi:hypothetical protein